MISILALITVLIGSFSPARGEWSVPPTRFQYSRIVMGVRANITLYAQSENQAKADADAAFARLEEIESVLSDYRMQSAVSALNEVPRREIEVPDDLQAVMIAAERVRKLSDGAFSPYLGSLTQLWRGSRDTHVIPSESALRDAGLGELPRFELLSWSGGSRDRKAQLLPSSIRIDLGGIGKGFAAHEAVKVLKSRGSPRCMVAIAGDIAVGDAPPEASGWSIEFTGEADSKPNILFLENRCVSTSGDSIQFVEINGQRYSHIVDPKSGLGCQQPWEATVISDDGATADAIATALCVQGPSGLNWISSLSDVQATMHLRGHAHERFHTVEFPDLYSVSNEILATNDEQSKRLEWFRHARFGMFIHWGLYSIPAGYWEGNRIDGIGEWIMHNGGIAAGEYEKLAMKFHPVSFDADEWMSIASEAGMKYFVITTKHHDGFCLFDSAQTKYDIVDATPFKRDIMSELSSAARRRGMRVGWYHSIMDWHHPHASGERFDSYNETLSKQVGELLTNYGPIDIMWFDGEWIGEWTSDRGRKLYDLCRSLQPNVIINNRVGKSRQGMAGMSGGAEKLGDFGTPEQEVPGGVIVDQAWESCMTMNDTWGFRSDDANFKTSKQIIRTLIETVSKGGNFLLNVGPDAQGRIPQESIERLKAVGSWMRVNGESIYGKFASPIGEQSFGRCTFGDGALYIHCFDLPAENSEHEIFVEGLSAEFTSAIFLADATLPIRLHHADGGVKLSFDRWPHDEASTVIKLELSRRNSAVYSAKQVTRQTGSELRLGAEHATYIGQSIRYERDKHCIGYWTNVNDRVLWNPVFTNPGVYRVFIDFACEDSSSGSEIEIAAADSSMRWGVITTGGWSKFQEIEIGKIVLRSGGFPVRVEVISKPGMAVMNLRGLRFLKVEP